MPASPWPPAGAGPARTGPVVADAQPQGIVGVVQFHVDGGARRVPPGVGEGFLDDAVGGQLDAGVEGGRRAADDEPGRRARGVPGLVEQFVELLQARLGLPVGAS